MLQTWREQKGVHATYRNLAGAFYVAGRINLIWEVCELLGARPSPSSSYEDVQELRKPPVRRRGGPGRVFFSFFLSFLLLFKKKKELCTSAYIEELASLLYCANTSYIALALI